MITRIVKMTFRKEQTSAFEKIFEDCENRIHAIITFLALLELVNLQELKITKGDQLNQFWVEEKTAEEIAVDPLIQSEDPQEEE